jgi:hypothetical protein
MEAAEVLGIQRLLPSDPGAAAFLTGTRDLESAELVDEDFEGEGQQSCRAEIFYELRNGLTVAYPVCGRPDDQQQERVTSKTLNRREELAS